MSNAPPYAAQDPTTPGAVLAGKYRVERILGKGGMGVVVEARHIALDERVALKFLLPEYAKHPEAAARFLREARAAVKIKSEHVARVSDVGTLESGAPYMVMEFLEGRDLSGVLEKIGVLSAEDAVDYVIQGCEAIAEAHGYGIVHRDLKPANLFLSKRPDGTPIVKVLDFGISKVMSGTGMDNLTKTTAAMGSALYMSPEQMQQTRSVDHRTDIYALGVALYELLAGKQPFYADTLPQLCAEILTGTPAPLREVRPDVSHALAAAIEKAYARDRSHRYQSIAEFVVALHPFAPHRSQTTIERIARMGGVAMPAFGASQPPAQPNAGTQLMQGNRGSPATVPLPVMGGPPTQGGFGAASSASLQRISAPHIVPGAYEAPVSARAAANFAGASTSTDLSSTSRRPGNSGKVGVFVAVVVSLLVGGGAASVFILRGRTPKVDPTSAASASAVPSTSAAPVVASSAPLPSAVPSADIPKPPESAKPVTVASVDVPVKGPGRNPGRNTPPAVVRPLPITTPPVAPPPITVPVTRPMGGDPLALPTSHY